jgi:hypothetical protein
MFLFAFPRLEADPLVTGLVVAAIVSLALAYLARSGRGRT